MSLAGAIERYFDSDLYRDLEARRHKIRDYAKGKYSWAKVGRITTGVYARLLAA